ncbi:tetratricopeptide repeat protein [Shinella sp. M31]|uniref:tetratricopeptide repeat protein n=1 Tax=Shinella sp. M31 TaxID=3368615 RepID=UPI003BA35498
MDMPHHGPTALDGDHFQVVPEPGSNKLVIYLTATGAPPRIYNFWNAGNAVKTHRIFVNHRRSWYQQGVPGLGETVEETARSIRAWADHLGVDEIYTVGGSMGGYGAVLFGCLLGARVLAFSWETELHFPASRSEKLMDKGTVVTYPDLAPLIASTGIRVFTIFGERDAVDAYSLSRIFHLPTVQVKSMQQVLHGPQNYLNKKGRLIPFLEAFVDNFDTIPDMPEFGGMLERPRFAELFFQTHQMHAAKRWPEAIESGCEALKILPTSDQCNWLVGEAYLGMKEPELAYPYFCAARCSGGTSIDFFMSHANCLRHMDANKEALQIYAQVVKKWPLQAKGHYGAGLSHLRLGDFGEASAAFKEAARLDPKNETYRKRAKQYSR